VTHYARKSESRVELAESAFWAGLLVAAGWLVWGWLTTG